MQLPTRTLLVAVAALTLSGVAAIEECTPEEATTVQSLAPLTTISAACPGLQFDAGGAPDVSNTAYCATPKCIKTIKKVRKALPKCKLNGVKVRTATKKLLEACGEGNDGDNDDDATDSGGGDPPATVAPGGGGGDATSPSETPKPTKTPKPSKTPKADNSDGDDGTKDGTTKAPKTTKPPTALFPTINDADLKKSTAGSASSAAEGADAETDEADDTSLIGEPIGSGSEDYELETVEEIMAQADTTTNTTSKQVKANSTAVTTVPSTSGTTTLALAVTTAVASLLVALVV